MTTDRWIVDFTDDISEDKSLVGGKGGQLGALTHAGFDVPPGFTVSTDAYGDFVADGALADDIGAILAGIDYDDADDVERSAARIRAVIATAELSAEFEKRLGEAYSALGTTALGTAAPGADVHVAVRSSGTAEDLAEASFAGMHDTYLDIQGIDDVLAAVKRCWASMFTARATSYRHKHGFDQLTVRIAVVVQTMIASEVSGVMFTGNPMTTATDETVINASFGLGEAIVSGIVTPDDFIVRSGTGKIKQRRVSNKLVRIVRDPARGSGTITEDVPAADRERQSLTDRQVGELTRLGRRVTQHYGGLPQDMEWGMVDGTFYLLQSRPITGVEFSWDADVNAWQQTPEDDDVVWARSFADEVWSGAITPLMFSIRGMLWQRGWALLCERLDLEDAAKMWMWKFDKAEAYFNTTQHRIIVEKTCPPPFRAGLVDKLPPDVRDQASAAPFSYLDYAKKYIKGQFFAPDLRIDTWIDALNSWPTERLHEAEGVPVEELQLYSDDELMRYLDQQIDVEGTQYRVLFPWFVYGRDCVSLLITLIGKWYDGDNEYATAELMSGVPERTITMEESHQLWTLADRISNSPVLRELINHHEGAEFFAALANSEEGREFLAEYQPFAQKYMHRGHGDRDIYYPRRSEDPSIDHTALKLLLDTPDPLIRETEVNKRREAVAEDVLANIRRKPLGALKAEVFKIVYQYTLKFFVVRDNERFWADRATQTIKLGMLELNRRLVERGAVESERDFYFLSRDELYDLANERTAPDDALLRAKITARMRDFDRFNSKEVQPPAYMRHNRAIDMAALASGDLPEGMFQGIGTSRGTVTGTARLAKSLSEIGRVQKGEILICNSTDPGWTPVFHTVSGIVGETGGMLAHFSCLSREYGLPAVQLEGALKLVPDGATITINGDTGVVTIEPETDTETEPVTPELATADN